MPIVGALYLTRFESGDWNLDLARPRTSSNNSMKTNVSRPPSVFDSHARTHTQPTPLRFGIIFT